MSEEATSLYSRKTHGFAYRLPLIAAMLVFLAVIGKLILSILEINSGKFLFSLDDAYIHLALAEQLGRGHYGINPAEFAAPSSSIIWPFLLAPFTTLRIGVEASLVLNIIAGLGTLIVFDLIIQRALCNLSGKTELVFRTFLILSLALSTNLAGLVLTGMEHSLQVFFTALLVHELIKTLDCRRTTWVLGLALVCGPLVRYENLAPTTVTLLILLIEQHYKFTFKIAGLVAVLIGSFSVFVFWHTPELLPSSVLVKSGVVRASAAIPSIFSNLQDNLKIWPAWPLVLILLFFLWRTICCKEKRILSVWITLFLVLHLLFGKFNWLSRYEIYAVCAAMCLLALELGSKLKEQMSVWQSSWKMAVIALLVSIFSWLYISDTIRTPLAANNLFLHQYQLHRFITDHWRKPIAVNDLGLVSFRNDHYVVDLVGLGSQEAYHLQYSGKEKQTWVNKITVDRGIVMAAVYSQWFSDLPGNWIPLAKLQLQRELIVAQHSEVTFYLLSPDYREEALKALSSFGKTLPPGVQLIPCAGQSLSNLQTNFNKSY